MKNLRQLVGRSGILPRSKRRQRLMNRRLRSETLEKRNLLAGGITASQNINPYDVNDDQTISVRDALGVINYLARSGAEGEQTGGGLTSRGTNGYYYDVNGDSKVSAGDALGVINALARAEGQPVVTPIELNFTEDDPLQFVDLLRGQANSSGNWREVEVLNVTIQGDINVVASDAVFPVPEIINDQLVPAIIPADPGVDQGNGQEAIIEIVPEEFGELNAGESSVILITYNVVQSDGLKEQNTAAITITGVNDEEFEYLLTARDLNDNEIVAQNGVVSVGVDQEFYLQVAYEDFRARSLGKNLGAFQLIADLAFDNPDLITPILNESQLLEITGNFRPTGTHGVRFTVPAFAPGVTGNSLTYEMSAAELAQTDLVFEDLIVNALTEFGYDASQYSLNPEDDGFRIVFDDPAFGNVDIPDITFDVLNSNGEIDSRVVGSNTVVPALVGDQPNSEAVPFSIDFRSNTFNNATFPDGFGTNFYSNLLDQDAGSYDPTTGFAGVGGIGGVPASGGGIPELGTFIEPFDSFSLRVKVNQDNQDVTASVSPATTENEFLLLYGYDNQRIPENIVTESTDTNDNGVAQLILSTKTPNLPPEVTGEVSATFSEDDTPVPFTVDLLAGASDPDGDINAATIRDLTPRDGDDTRGITQDGTNLLVDPSQYGFLDVNESAVIVYTYTIVDVRGGTVDQTATITITGEFDANQPPVIQSGQTFEIQENSAQGTVVGDVIANDPEGGALTYNIIGGNTGSAFQIDNDGEITVLTEAAIDFDTTPVFTLSVEVTDDAQQTDVEDVIVNLTDINESPIFNDQPIALPETTQPNDVFATLDATDPEGVQLTFNLVSGNEDGDLALSDDGQLSLVTTDDLVINDSYTLVVTASDGVNDPVSATVTVTVTDEPQPPAVSDSTFTIDENIGVDTLVGTVNALDPDGNEGLVYTILTGNDAGDFTLDSTNGEIRVAGDINFEDISSYTLNVQVTDPGGLSGTGTITINVNDLNEAPIVEDQLFVVPEDLAVGGEVGTIQATDPDGDDLTYNITGGNDGNVFSLNEDTGLLTTNVALDFEAVDSYTLDVTVSDAELGSTADITITITDVNEPAVFDDISMTFSEQDAFATVDLLAGAVDPEGFTDQLTIENLTLASGPGIGITPDGTELDVDPDANGDLVDDENRTSVYTFDVVDNGGVSAPRTATIRVNGFNDAPNARDDSRSAIVDQVVTINVLENDDVGDGESGVPVLVTAALDAASEANADLTFNTNDGTVTITPELDYEGPINFTYTISDAQNSPLEATANGQIIYRNFEVSTISGMVFEDHLENGIDVILNGADEIRNGVKEGDEAAIAGLTIHLFSAAADNVTGEEVSMTATTDMHGAYTFGNLPPGEFELELLDVDPSLLNPTEDALKFARDGGIISVGGPAVQIVSIDNPLGGETITGVDWHVVSKDPGLDTNNLIASGNRNGNKDENGNQQGLFALLDDNGMQVYVGVMAGYDAADSVKVSYDQQNDRALLEVMAEGNTFTRVLADDEFELTDGDKMQVFGGLDDLFSGSSDGNDSFLGSSNNS